MERIKIQMLDPTFLAGDLKTATVTISVKPSGLNCTAELWLSKEGVTKDATSVKDFISTGLDQGISLALTMPVGGYAYRVLLDIYVGGMLITAYEATEEVVIPWISEPEIVW